MKKSNLLYSMFFVFGPLFAAVGCMDNSKHTNTRDGYDYKTLHYVSCNCPCKKYRHLARKGKCFKCRHYIKIDDGSFSTALLGNNNNSKSLIPDVHPFIYF